MAEFLPLCDVLFNVISLAGYFCDVVFDVVLSYALFERGRFVYFALVITLVMVSLIISQVSSIAIQIPHATSSTDYLIHKNSFSHRSYRCVGICIRCEVTTAAPHRLRIA